METETAKQGGSLCGRHPVNTHFFLFVGFLKVLRIKLWEGSYAGAWSTQPDLSVPDDCWRLIAGCVKEKSPTAPVHIKNGFFYRRRTRKNIFATQSATKRGTKKRGDHQIRGGCLSHPAGPLASVSNVGDRSIIEIICFPTHSASTATRYLLRRIRKTTARQHSSKDNYKKNTLDTREVRIHQN